MPAAVPDPFEEPFDHTPRTRLVYGSGAIDRLGELAAGLGASRVLLVTDAGIVAAGHVARAERALVAAGLAVACFDAVRENPTTDDVDRCLAFVRDRQPDLFIGLGGGSSIDTAKGCNFLLTNGGRMEDYWGVGKAARPLLPLIAVPTTAGTGTEVQSFTLIERASDHQKMACGAASAAPRIALLDPQLTLSQPRHVTACTGMDTVTHAVESFVTRKRNAISALYAREAFRLAQRSLPQVLAQPADLAARGAMLQAAAFAGLAIEASMLGAAHSLANPLTAHFRVPHGEAVGMMLPHVVRFNAADPQVAALYRELMVAAGLATPADEAGDAVARLIGVLDDLLYACALAGGPRSHGVDHAALPALAVEAARQWTAQFNPRPVGEPELRALYAAALSR